MHEMLIKNAKDLKEVHASSARSIAEKKIRRPTGKSARS
jgi:hypothetical protein